MNGEVLRMREAQPFLRSTCGVCGNDLDREDQVHRQVQTNHDTHVEACKHCWSENPTMLRYPRFEPPAFWVRLKAWWSQDRRKPVELPSVASLALCQCGYCRHLRGK